MKKGYALDVVWKIQGPIGIILVTQNVLFKIQLDCKEKIHNTKIKSLAVKLKNSPN